LRTTQTWSRSTTPSLIKDESDSSRRRCRTTLVICGGALTGAVAFGQKQFLESQARVVSAHYRVLLLCQLCQCRNDSPLHQPARQRNGSPSRHLPDSGAETLLFVGSEPRS